MSTADNTLQFPLPHARQDATLQTALDEQGCLLDIGISWFNDNSIEYLITPSNRAFPNGITVGEVLVVLQRALLAIDHDSKLEATDAKE